MSGINNKRTCTSYRIMISVDQVKRYKEVIKQDCKDTEEYCEAKIALERAIPDWLYRKAWSIAKEIHFMEQILTATGHEWHEARDEVRRNLERMED